MITLHAVLKDHTGDAPVWQMPSFIKNINTTDASNACLTKIITLLNLK